MERCASAAFIFQRSSCRRRITMPMPSFVGGLGNEASTLRLIYRLTSGGELRETTGDGSASGVEY
jgi:hypothetical protein